MPLVDRASPVPVNDTPPHVEKLYLDMLMKKSPEERLKMASRMYDAAKILVISGIKRRHPNLTEAQLRGQFLRCMYGQDFTEDELQKIASNMPNMELNID